MEFHCICFLIFYQHFQITILNTKKRGDHYEEITAEQYEAFMSYGAKYGAYQVMTDNYQDSLDKIQTKIQNEINIRNNMKHFIALKEMRTTLIQKYVDANKDGTVTYDEFVTWLASVEGAHI